MRQCLSRVFLCVWNDPTPHRLTNYEGDESKHYIPQTKQKVHGWEDKGAIFPDQISSRFRQPYFVSNHKNAVVLLDSYGLLLSVTCSCLCKFGNMHLLGGCHHHPLVQWCGGCGSFSFFWYLHLSHLRNCCFQRLSWFSFWCLNVLFMQNQGLIEVCTSRYFLAFQNRVKIGNGQY